MTHYHNGNVCTVNLCHDLKDACDYRDPDRGACTLVKGHPTGALYRGFSDDGHLYFGDVPTESDVDEDPDDPAGQDGRCQPIGCDAGVHLPGCRRAAVDATEADLGSVLTGEIPSSAVLSQDLPVGIRSHGPTPVGAATASPAGFTGPDPEALRAAGQRLAVTLRDASERMRQSMVSTASARTLVAALVERARTEAPPTGWPDSAATLVDDVCEALRGSGLFTPADVATVRTVITHLLRSPERHPERRPLPEYRWMPATLDGSWPGGYVCAVPRDDVDAICGEPLADRTCPVHGTRQP